MLLFSIPEVLIAWNNLPKTHIFFCWPRLFSEADKRDILDRSVENYIESKIEPLRVVLSGNLEILLLPLSLLQVMIPLKTFWTQIRP